MTSHTEQNTQGPALAECDMRPAVADDVPAIIAILESGRALLAADGIDQWQNGTGPTSAIVADDVLRGWARVFTVGGKVAATAALMGEPDPNYAHIEDGAWATPTAGTTLSGISGGPRYATIHRVAVSPAFRGQRVAQRFYARLIEEARARGFAEIRVDTHDDNKRMQRVIESQGFSYAGRVFNDLDPKQPRRAYQLFL